MNLDKKAEIVAGFTSTHIYILGAVVVVSLILSFIVYSITRLAFVGFGLFVFLFATAIWIVKSSQNQPDGFFMNWLENRTLPRYYMPGDNNEADE
jgi:hypothetical protein